MCKLFSSNVPYYYYYYYAYVCDDFVFLRAYHAYRFFNARFMSSQYFFVNFSVFVLSVANVMFVNTIF